MTAKLRTALAGLAAALLAALVLMAEPSFYRTLRDSSLARVSQLAEPPASGKVAVVEIDEASSAALGDWPWPRQEIARLVNAAAASGAQAIALDIVLSGRCDDPGNAALEQALQEEPATLGFVIPGSERDAEAISAVAARPTAELPDLWQSEGAEMPCPQFMRQAQGLATVSIAGELSAAITSVPAAVAVGQTLYPGLAADGVRLWERAAAVMIDGAREPAVLIGPVRGHLDPAGGLSLRASAPARWSARTLSAKDVLAAPAEALRGKLVFIGSSLARLGSLRPTAADPLAPSVQIHADIAESLLTASVPWRPRFAPFAEFAMILAGTLTIIFASLRMRPVAAAAVTAALAIAAALAAIAAQLASGFLIDPLLPPAALAAAGVAAGLSQYAASRKTEAAMRRSFEQRLPASVVARLAQGPGGEKIAGEERIVTALFTDIEGFTAMTGAVPPTALVKLLDGYFEGVNRIVMAHGGFVDKIVGDAAHAFFNMPDSLNGHEGKALDCAFAIIDFSERYRKRKDAEAAGFGRTRIGVETGPAVVGDVGAAGKFDYSAHGSSVNLAARLQEANKVTGTSILAGPGIGSAQPPGWTFESLGKLDLRGFGPTEVFSPRKS